MQQEQKTIDDLTLEEAKNIIVDQSNQLQMLSGRLEVTIRQREAAMNEAAALEVIVRQLQAQLKQGDE